MALALCAAPLAKAQEPVSDIPALLEVRINGYPIGKIGEFVQRGPELYATRQELLDLGFALGAQGDPDELTALRSIPGVTYSIDERNQLIDINAPSRVQVGTVLDGRLTEALPPIEATRTGAVLNYDALVLSDSSGFSANALIEARGFGNWGVIETSGLLTSADETAFRRLNSTFTLSDPARVRRLRFGDVISSSLDWTRSVRLGGIQLNTDFGLRPDLITFPLPQITGQASVPSTVDILVNGVRQISQPVPAGPFSVRNLPLFTGAGTVQVVLENPTGRETVDSLPFYSTPTLLRKGLTSYSIEAGWMRRNFGTISNDYNQLAASATLRRGMADRITLEGHAEAAQGVAVVGGGLNLTLGEFGLAAVGGSLSLTDHGRDHQFFVSLERSARQYSLAGLFQHAGPNFADSASVLGDSTTLQLIQASAATRLGGLGSIALAYTDVIRGPGPLTPAGPTGPPETSRFTLGSMSFTRSLPHSTSLFINANHSLDGSNRTGVMVGLTMSLGPRQTGSVNVQGSNKGGTFLTATAAKSAFADGDLGWRLVATEGPVDHFSGEVAYRASFASVSAGAETIGEDFAVRAGARGSLIFLGGDVMAANTIQDSFAIVETPGLTGVEVRADNRPVGRTNQQGRLLVPSLRAYEANRLTISPDDLPLDVELIDARRVVRPSDRSGVLVRFDTRRGAAARVRLVDSAGKDLPLGSMIALEGSGVTTAVGYDGQAYLQDLAPENRILVNLPNGATCEARFGFRPVPGELPDLGVVTCQGLVEAPSTQASIDNGVSDVAFTPAEPPAATLPATPEPAPIALGGETPPPGLLSAFAPPQAARTAAEESAEPAFPLLVFGPAEQASPYWTGEAAPVQGASLGERREAFLARAETAVEALREVVRAAFPGPVAPDPTEAPQRAAAQAVEAALEAGDPPFPLLVFGPYEEASPYWTGEAPAARTALDPQPPAQVASLQPRPARPAPRPRAAPAPAPRSSELQARREALLAYTRPAPAAGRFRLSTGARPTAVPNLRRVE